MLHLGEASCMNIPQTDDLSNSVAEGQDKSGKACPPVSPTLATPLLYAYYQWQIVENQLCGYI